MKPIIKAATLFLFVLLISCHNEKNTSIKYKTNIPSGYRGYYDLDTSKFDADVFYIDTSKYVFIGVSAPNDSYLLSYIRHKNKSVWEKKILDTNIHFKPYLLRHFDNEDYVYLYYPSRIDNKYYIYAYKKANNSIARKLTYKSDKPYFVFCLAGISNDYVYIADFDSLKSKTYLTGYSKDLDEKIFSFSINEEVRSLNTYNDSTYLLVTNDNNIVIYNRYLNIYHPLNFKQKIHWNWESALKTDFSNNCIYITFYNYDTESSTCYRYTDNCLTEIFTYKHWHITNNIQVTKNYVLFFLEKKWPYYYNEKILISYDFGKTFKEVSIFRHNVSEDINVVIFDDSIYYYNRYDYYELVKCYPVVVPKNDSI